MVFGGNVNRGCLMIRQAQAMLTMICEYFNGSVLAVSFTKCTDFFAHRSHHGNGNLPAVLMTVRRDQWQSCLTVFLTCWEVKRDEVKSCTIGLKRII
ncbi:MAG: hypothetical protein CSA34_01120 [Desulfobulbus propionicus]|nr:MAG: hypothetical protein CSA34_01120 [Desulfobulbus propionicus]